MPATVPSPLNYFLGKGIVKWMQDPGPTYRDLGNAPEFECSPSVERKDHFSSRLGVRTRDFSVVSTKMMAVRFILDELTDENFALYFMGGVTAPVAPATYSTVSMMDLGNLNGALRLIGTNDVGFKLQVDIPSVNLAPQGNLQFIQDEYGRIEINGQVTADPVTGIMGTILWGTDGTEVMTP
jgi:hypothetical protein